MKAAGPAAKVVDRTDHLNMEDTAVKTEDTSVQAVEDTTVAVDDVDDTVAVTAATAAGAYLETNTHTASVFSMNHP